MFSNQSKRLESIYLPSEVLFSTVLIDIELLESNNLEAYDKILLVSDTPVSIDISGFVWKLYLGNSRFFISLYEKPSLSCETTFIIQGLAHEHTPMTILYTAPYGSISLGIWDTDLDQVELHQKTSNTDNYYNKYFQILSTLKGLSPVRTLYSIKLRSDEYFINFIPFLEKLRALQPYQILTSNIFFKKANVWPYHISDHILGGKTESLLLMFERARINAETRTLLNITPEVHLAVSYLQHFGDAHPEDRNVAKICTYMYRFFDLFSIWNFENYKAKGTSYISKEDGRVRDINTVEQISDFQF